MIQLTDVDLVIPPIRKGDEARSLLTGINLTLSERRVAVIGANGSGKSSLLRLLNGMRQPTSGTVSVKGHDVAEEPRKVRQLVGFIFTDPLAQLLMSTPIEDLTLSLGHLPRKERTGRAQQILDERGLGHLAHQSNKLALRRALAELEQQVIYSTHDMDVAADADRVIVIEGGRVTADGEPGEVIAWYERAMGVTG